MSYMDVRKYGCEKENIDTNDDEREEEKTLNKIETQIQPYFHERSGKSALNLIE